jgi:hypothetical protein
MIFRKNTPPRPNRTGMGHNNDIVYRLFHPLSRRRLFANATAAQALFICLIAALGWRRTVLAPVLQDTFADTLLIAARDCLFSHGGPPCRWIAYLHSQAYYSCTIHKQHLIIVEYANHVYRNCPNRNHISRIVHLVGGALMPFSGRCPLATCSLIRAVSSTSTGARRVGIAHHPIARRAAG